MGQAERSGFVKPREKIGQGIYCSLQLFNGRMERRQTLLEDAQWKDEGHQGQVGTQEIRHKDDGWSDTGTQVQRGCGNSILGVIQISAGQPCPADPF